jgi:predicted nucleotidyltransferase
MEEGDVQRLPRSIIVLTTGYTLHPNLGTQLGQQSTTRDPQGAGEMAQTSMRHNPSTVPYEAAIPVVPWLDEESSSLVRAVVASVAHAHRNLRAAVLYGSVARHEERPLTDDAPSDVDLLLLFDLALGQNRLAVEQRLAISESIGQALDRHPDAPREVQTLYAVGDLTDWDTTFVGNVARD